MRLVFDRQESRFVCECSYDEREAPRSAGFHWDGAKKEWWTSRPEVASRLAHCADEGAQIALAESLIVVTKPPLIRWPGDKSPYSYQIEAARFAASRNRSYLGLDPGLGKTATAAMVCNSLGVPAAYICPPFLVETVREELARWTPRAHPAARVPEIRIFPDSRIHRATVREELAEFSRQVPAPALIVDEAHRYKNPDAWRTRALFGCGSDRGIVGDFHRVMFLSGTPVPNRPLELFPLLSRCAPETIRFMSKFDYGRRYCAGHKGPFGWDFKGASNLTELAGAVKQKFMLRVRKADVLKELPPKIEEMLLIGEDLPPTVARLDKDLLRQFSPEDLCKGLAPNNHISTYRRELGRAKAPLVAEAVKEILQDSDESVLVFAIHTDAVAELEKALAKFHPVVIVGSTPTKTRHQLVREFQDNSERRLFIGNIEAAGTGFTMTKATRVIFAEFSWVPAQNDQASDRAHRIGQRDSVYVQYCVFKNSCDRAVLETNLRKRKITDQV